MARAVRTPRVGILVECGRDGLEIHICRRICMLLREQHGAVFEERIVPMDNKDRLLRECGSTSVQLIREGIDRILLLWDEEPSWPDRHERLCWLREKDQALAAMQAAAVDLRVVDAICIEKAVESWLLFDEGLLTRVLSRPTYQARVKVPANPDRLRNVKGVLMSVFKKHGQRYVDVVWASKLAAALSDCNRLRRCKTFRRFAEKLVGQPLWQ